MNVLRGIRHYGLQGSARRAMMVLGRKSGYTNWRFRHTPKYVNPTPTELEVIERDLIALGVAIEDYVPSAYAFKEFQDQGWFPPDYHGGQHSGVWDEKLLEHWISSERLGLMDFNPEDIFVDVAAASSPWVQGLRERKRLTAFAIDLCEVGVAYRHLPYYRIENATQTTFLDGSVKGATLHCAYEMFMGDDDTRFISEAARILKPGGKVVILPLYMHTHYCAYATQEYFGKGYSDPTAKEYVRLDTIGIPSSRKYDADMLKKRVLGPIQSVGLHYRLLALRNKAEFGKNVYCHFILEIER